MFSLKWQLPLSNCLPALTGPRAKTLGTGSACPRILQPLHRPPFKTRPGRWHLGGENSGSNASVVKGRTSFGLTFPWDKGDPQGKELDGYYGVHYGLLSLLGRRRESNPEISSIHHCPPLPHLARHAFSEEPGLTAASQQPDPAVPGPYPAWTSGPRSLSEAAHKASARQTEGDCYMVMIVISS